MTDNLDRVEAWLRGEGGTFKTTDDLIAEFIRARLDEWEAAAESAEGSDWFTGSSEDSDQRSVHYIGPSTLYPGREGDYALADHVLASTAEHIARYDPARVLRLVTSLRRVVDGCEHTLSWLDHGHGLASDTLSHVAAIWDRHPGYNPDWEG